MIKNYFKIALRNFKRHKLFTFINIVGLCTGITASLIIFLIVYNDFTFDQFHKDKDRIYRVVSDFNYAGEPFYNSGVTGPLPQAVKNEVTGVEMGVPIYTQDYNVIIPHKEPAKFKDQQNIVFADQQYFKMFSYKWLAGSAKSMDLPHQVVLTADEAKKYFPSLSYQAMLGKQVIYDDSVRTTVGGVIEPFKENSDFNFQDFISWSTQQSIKSLKQQLTTWGTTNGSSQYFIKLLPGVTVNSIERKLRHILLKYEPDQAKNVGYKTAFRLQPLSDVHFNEKYGAINKAAVNKNILYGLMIIAAFLLLLGCINFINLTTAQASQRAKEIGIRKTMGSSHFQLISQFLSETFLVTLLAVIISLLAAPFIMKLFSDFISKDISFNVIDHPAIMVFCLILVVVVSLASGFYPAMMLAGYQPVTVLKNQPAGTAKSRNAWIRKSLTVSQFIIAQFFIMATIMVSKQIYYALHKDLGFKKDAIVYINLPWKQRSASLKQVLLNKIKALPQVKMVSLSGDVPSSTSWSSAVAVYRDGKKDITTQLFQKTGDENYINIYHIKLLTGRNITLADTATSMLINTTYAHILGFTNIANALGKTINFGTRKKQVVGVIGDFHQASLHDPIKPMAILPEKPEWENVIHIALKPQTADGNEWKSAIASMEKYWKEIYPQEDFAYHYFDQSLVKMYEQEQRISKLLRWATGLSVLISCLGLLGLAMFTTNLRIKEIGVRKVLGATVMQIVTLLSSELVLLVFLAFIIVCPVAWWGLNKWMQNFVDRTPISWWIFALSGAGMLLTALLTLSFQTLKAARANPVKSLRSE